MKKLTDYIKLPVKTDDYGMYVWDAESHMVLDAAHLPHDQMKVMGRFAAMSLNAAHGNGAKPHTPDGFTLPFMCDEDGMNIIDSGGKIALHVRGWGRLQYLGTEEGIAAQKLIGQAFADAMN